MRIHTFDSEQQLARALAERIAAAIRERPSTVLGLATGRTPISTYKELCRLHAERKVNFSDVSTFNLDEFVGVSATDPGSFRHYMDEHLFGEIDLRPERIHFLSGIARDLDAECARYERDIEAAGGIDLQLLGIGTNGHIGFNEPGDELVALTHRVTLHPGTRRDNAEAFGGDPDRVPREALSMGMATILKTGIVVLIATGQRKAKCVEQTVHGPLTTKLPASFLQTHRRVELYLDRAAASLLSAEDRS